MSKTAIIIGAGPAGLTCAYELLKKSDVKPIIYEESNEIGGISKTVKYKNNRIDIGGHRFFSKDDDVNKLWEEIMPLQGKPAKDDLILNVEKPLSIDGPDPEKEERVMLVRNRVSRIFYLRKFFDYPISLKVATFVNMGFIRTVKAGFGYIKSSIFKRKENSLQDFMINRFGTPLYKMFFEDYTEKVWGRNPKDIAADWGAQRIKGLSLSKAILAVLTKPFKKKSKNVETSLIEQFHYPKKGPGQLYETMADLIISMGGEIHLNHKITKINLENNQITSVEATVNGESKVIKGDYYVSTMPIKDLYLGMGEDKIDSEVYNIATNLLYRDFITVGLLLNKLKIKNQTKHKTLNNIVPDCWIYIQEREVKLGRLQIFNNWSPYMLEDPEHNIWIGLEYFCNEGDEMWEMNDEKFIEFAINELASIDIIDKEDVLDAIRIKVKKAYPAYFGVYDQFNKVKEHLNTITNLYCIGRNGQHRYNNMDHSMLTGMMAARSIIDPKSVDKTKIWDVNTEKSYHEEKSK
jgi:protoporphyrinogen oxidase